MFPPTKQPHTQWNIYICLKMRFIWKTLSYASINHRNCMHLHIYIYIFTKAKVKWYGLPMLAMRIYSLMPYKQFNGRLGQDINRIMGVTKFISLHENFCLEEFCSAIVDVNCRAADDIPCGYWYLANLIRQSGSVLFDLVDGIRVQKENYRLIGLISPLGSWTEQNVWICHCQNIILTTFVTTGAFETT